MSVLDIILVVILLFFVWQGFKSGLIGAIGGFIGILVGIWAGTYYMDEAADWISEAINIDNAALANILGFVAIFVGINIVVALLVIIINKIFHIIPFIDLVNKILGAFVGLIGGALAISALVYLLSLMPISDAVSNALISSQLAHWAAQAAIVIKPFLPEAVNNLKSILTI